MTRTDLPCFAKSEFTDKVQKLYDYIQQQDGEIEALQKEIARLKGVSPKPNLKPARPVGDPSSAEGDNKKRGGSKPGARRSKTGEIEIHATC